MITYNFNPFLNISTVLLNFFVTTGNYIKSHILPTLDFNTFFKNSKKILILNMLQEIITWDKKEKWH